MRDESSVLREAKSRAQSDIGDRSPWRAPRGGDHLPPTAPDADDWLRRLFTLLLEHAAG